MHEMVHLRLTETEGTEGLAIRAPTVRTALAFDRRKSWRLVYLP